MFDNFFVDTHLARAEDNLASVIATLQRAYPEQWMDGGALAYTEEVNEAIASASALRSRVGYLRAKVA